jgi:hypothetical protein
VPHPFAFFLAKGWDSTNLKAQIHVARDIVGSHEENSWINRALKGHDFSRAKRGQKNRGL